MPSYVALLLSEHFASAFKAAEVDRFVARQADNDLTVLLEQVGGCERIRNTPLPRAYSVVIRQFLLVFLLTLPLGLLKKVGDLTPLVSILIAYPLLVLDEVGVILQFPFTSKDPRALPLDEMCRTIETDLDALLSVVADIRPGESGGAAPGKIPSLDDDGELPA
jgi:putative membrane protein